MGLLDIFKAPARSRPSGPFTRQYTAEGLKFQFTRPLQHPSVDALLALTDGESPEDSILAAYLGQLVNEDVGALSSKDVAISWVAVYDLLTSPEHRDSVLWLGVPAIRDLRPILDCENTLADRTFGLQVDGWVENSSTVEVENRRGAVVRVDGADFMLPLHAWRAVEAIQAFGARADAERSQHDNEIAWGRIRSHADAAGALYRSPYLETTFVLTPDTLRMPLRREETPFGRVLIVEPTFDGAPSGWLKALDGFNSVQPHYDLAPRGGGHVRVVVSEPVRKVLEVIKREMPQRRVAGSRAERFVHNPWAFLGESAHEVLKEEDFAADKAGAGALSTTFYVAPTIDENRIESVDLVLTEQFHGGTSRTERSHFSGPEELEAFLGLLDAALKNERLQFPWQEFDLSIDGESALQLERGRQIAHLWRTQPAAKILFDDVYGLEGYSGRIEGIGVARAIYVPVVQKPSSEDEGKPGWIPADLIPMVKVTLAGHEGQVVIPLSKEWVEKFDAQVREAETRGAAEVANESLPTPIPTPQARTLADSFRVMLGVPDKVKPDGQGKGEKDRTQRETLLVKLNFFGIDYAEERRRNLAVPSAARAELPRSLRASISLKEHQLTGVAWFQHLVSRAPVDCRGALLADDMGLGKTLQLLCLLGWYYEQFPNAAPSVILAPKSLVENWAAETKKFFTESFPQALVLYGSELQARKQPLGLIDSQLTSRGIVDLLRPNWVGAAKVVFTTYEVLTNYEFSLARQPFAFAICDEAQRIKTPGTLVTLAAKALKADFRIACTGTPVENSLADLWCLFDFVQPGLLGGLEEFGRTYRRPIECETEEHRSALSMLQQAIAPQTLRRTKLDIAKELPKKYFGYTAANHSKIDFKETLADSERLLVPISAHQNLLYLGGLKKLQDAAKESDGRKRARLSFGALHLMKAVCAEPYCLPGMKFLPDQSGHSTHLVNSPKLAWLLRQLEAVKASGEKAIVFTELREVQSALYYFLREKFGLKPFIVNGDSQNRHSYIQRFSDAKGFDVIILSTLAAGAGLNVTAANHVFHFTRAWNPAKENQATDRAYRIGQERNVYVYCPVSCSDDYATFDVRLDELLRRKATLANATLTGSNMEAMLNGAGIEVKFTELIAEGTAGSDIPKRPLTIDDVDRLDGFHFEVFCRLLWSKAGYLAQLTNKKGGDGGIDVIAFKGADGELLQCKSSTSNAIGWDAVKEVVAGAARYQAQFPGARFRRIAVTNRAFNSTARTQAELNGVALVERAQLEQMLVQHPMHNHELDGDVGACVPSLDAA